MQKKFKKKNVVKGIKKALTKATPISPKPSSLSKKNNVKETKNALSKLTRAKPKKSNKIKPALLTSNTSVKEFSRESFPIVGIGASAGGLEALEEFFSNLPPNSGMAFVIIMHQSADRISILPELLKKFTEMDVTLISHRLKLKHNCVYLPHPGKNVSIFNGVFHVFDSEEESGFNLPIDSFFSSLAQDQRDKAICIILSGTGTDGTLGLRAIKSESGMAIVQEASSAKFSGMPRSALATNLVDYELPPAKMPGRLLKYVQGPFLSSPLDSYNAPPPSNETMLQFFEQIRNCTGHDFSMYKPNTIRRRIERRMNVHNINQAEDYLKFLRKNPQETNALFKELLIGVTSFFRDANAFKYLQEKVIPKLLKSKSENSSIRIWAPGCATGEEVYSLAILFTECQKKLNKKRKIQIFGTDIDSHAIDVARSGLYPHGIAANISSKYLKSYFNKDEHNYRIAKSIREMAVFAPQSVTKDPPFTKLDLISCRNLLIYLETELQKNLFSLFHYSLKSNGYLFLGGSESLGASSVLFNPVSKKWKIFSRNNYQSKSTKLEYANIFTTPSMKEGYREPLSMKFSKKEIEMPIANIQILLEKYLLNKFTPACVLVDEQGEIFYIHGRTGDYLEPSHGKPNLNILAMARDGLKIELAAALREVCHKNKPILKKDLTIKNNERHISLNLTVQKFEDSKQFKDLILVVFSHPIALDTASGQNKKANDKESKMVSQSKMQKLKEELQYTKESLQSTIGELETTNEELKSTNEELQSTNEELQSSNEEIETSKEEMQSLNEELQTTNSELQAKIEEYSMANDDMKNLLNSTDIATIFLDNNQNIKRFTTEAQKIINLIPSDIGRPITDIVSKLQYTTLSKDCAQVIKTLIFHEQEVQTKKNHYYRLRIFPYRTTENKIDGLVLTFIDINDLKVTEKKLIESLELMPVLNSLPTLVSYIDTNECYKICNKAYETWFKLKQKDIQGKQIKKILGTTIYKKMNNNISVALNGKKSKHEIELLNPKGIKRKTLVQYVPHFDKNKNVSGCFTIITDIQKV